MHNVTLTRNWPNQANKNNEMIKTRKEAQLGTETHE